MHEPKLTRNLPDSVMLKKVQEAVKMRGDHVGDFLALSASLPAASVQTFSKLIQDWEGGLSEENPYEVTVEGVLQWRDYSTMSDSVT